MKLLKINVKQLFATLDLYPSIKPSSPSIVSMTFHDNRHLYNLIHFRN